MLILTIFSIYINFLVEGKDIIEKNNKDNEYHNVNNVIFKFKILWNKKG